MLVGQSGDQQFNAELGFSLNPLKAIKKVGGGIATGARAVGHGVSTGARAVGHGAKVAGKVAWKASYLPLKYTLIKPTEWLAHAATAPVRAIVGKMRNRRAAKLAWDRRKSKTPTPQEQAEAKAWTKSNLASKGPHGKILSYFAGAPDHLLYAHFAGPSDDGQLGVAPAVIAAMVPVLMALANSLIQQFAKSGEAPVNPEQGAGPDPSVPANADAQAAEAVAQAAGDVQDAAQDAAAEAGGGGQMVRLPGGMKAQRGNLLLYGGLAAAVVVAILIMKKKKD